MKEQIADFLKQYQRELKEAAAELCGRPMPPLTEELFSLFERTGNRLAYERVYFLRRKYLAVFGMNAVLWERPEDIEELERVIADICAETCWALPAHVERTHDKEWRHTLDLFACETAGALAEIGELLKGRLSEKTRETIAREVCGRVIRPFEASSVPCGRWENCDHNWNAVCGGSIGIAAIRLLQREPQRKQALLKRICASLRYYIGGFADDGTCLEGAGYFTYGMYYYTAFAQLLRRDEGDDSLLKGDKIARIMEFQQKCYFPGGLSVSFSDGSSREGFRVGLACFLHETDAAAAIPPMSLAAGLHTDPCYRWVMLYRDMLWAEHYLKDGTSSDEVRQREEEGFAQVILPDAQWSICRSPMGAGAAVKGGNNAEPHNHNDVGSFHYVLGSEVFLADLGAGEYTKEYFQEETRYSVFVNQSFSHNVPIINGQPQKSGSAFRCGGFEADGDGKTTLEFAAAYGTAKLRSLRRTLLFSQRDGSLEVTDVFLCGGGADAPARGEAADGQTPLQIRENLVTPWRPRLLESGTVLLAGKKNVCILRIETDREVFVQEQTYADHDGREQRVYLLRWEVPVKEQKGQARFRILPDTEALFKRLV